MIDPNVIKDILPIAISVVAITISVISGLKVFDRLQRFNAKDVTFWLDLPENTKKSQNNSRACIINTSNRYTMTHIEAYIRTNKQSNISLIGYLDSIQTSSTGEIIIFDSIDGLASSKEVAQIPQRYMQDVYEIGILFNTSPKSRWIRTSDNRTVKLRQKDRTSHFNRKHSFIKLLKDSNNSQPIVSHNNKLNNRFCRLTQKFGGKNNG